MGLPRHALIDLGQLTWAAGPHFGGQLLDQRQKFEFD
jgi:hypothetical protein